MNLFIQLNVKDIVFSSVFKACDSMMSQPIIRVHRISLESEFPWKFKFDQSLRDLVDAFCIGMHRVLVTTRENKTVMLSQSDVIRFINDMREESSLSPLMSLRLQQFNLKTQSLITMNADESALSGFLKLNQPHMDLAAVPVVDTEGQLLATLSSSDLRGLRQNNFQILLLPVLEFLQIVKTQIKQPYVYPSKPIVSTLNSTFSQTIATILPGQVHRSWVVKSMENLGVIGVVTMSDILSVFGDFDFLHSEPNSTNIGHK